MKKSFAGLLVFIVVFCALGNSVRAEQSNAAVVDRWIDQNGEYAYPITPDMEEWNSLGTAQELWDATQIPEEIITKISTEDLICLIEEYPFLCDLKAYDTFQQGYEVIKERFNGIKELLSREDCYSKLLEAYNNFEIPSERIMDYSKVLSEENYVEDFNAMIQNNEYRKLIFADSKIYNSITILELLIVDILDEGNEDAEIFVEAYSNKLEEKLSTAYYDEVNAVSLLNILISENNSLLSSFDVVVTYGVSTTNESPISYTIYTPSGTAVSCDYYQNLNYVSSSTYADEVASYPGAILISGASTTFNCHSFAWLQDLYPDTYQHIWLNSVTSFLSDPEYTKLSAPTSASDIAYTPGHSAKVISISKSNPNNHNIPEPFLISKWGPGPVVQHYLSCSPYSATGVQYYAK